MNFSDPFLILALAAVVLALAFLGWALMERRRAGKAEQRAWDLRERYAETEARMKVFEDQSATQAELLRHQAAQSANAVAEELIKRSDETFRNRELLAQQRIEAQLKPVAETLAKFEAHVSAVEKTRAEETGGLKQQIAALMEASTATQAEARKLSAALRRGAGVQGRWGEQTLRNVLDAAGLTAHYDFSEQFTLDTEEGRRRPDVKVKMPAGAVFAIDAKCSLNAFLEAQDAVDDAAREAAMIRHAQSVRGHMQSLSAKAYWDQFASERSPDFVAMFVPGDGFLAAALDRMPDLMTEAMDKRVLLVTPTTLFALCKAVAYGWRVEEQAANADKIAALGRELYKRLSVMGGHAASVGKALEAAVSRYNQFVGSLETQVLTQARRFEDLKVDHEGKEIPLIEPVESAVRPLAKLSGEEAARLGALGDGA
jgi:DNA recombination protein RmuC